MSGEPEARLAAVYAAFNARDVDRALAALHPDVDWPNGLEGGRVHGHGPRSASTGDGSGSLIDPRVEPRGFSTEADGRVAVDVRQVVRDRAGVLLKDEMVQHVYRIDDGLVRSMEIRSAPSARRALTRRGASAADQQHQAREQQHREDHPAEARPVQAEKSSMPAASPATAGSP